MTAEAPARRAGHLGRSRALALHWRQEDSHEPPAGVAGLVFAAGAAMPVGPEDFDKGLNAAKRGDYVEALKWYRRAAEQGHVSTPE